MNAIIDFLFSSITRIFTFFVQYEFFRIALLAFVFSFAVIFIVNISKNN